MTDSKRKLVFSTAFLGCALVLSNLLGLVRDRIFILRFGAGLDLDAYYAAFRIPDLIFNLLILGALFSAFIPIFTDYISKDEKDEAFKVANSLINITLLGLLVISGILFFLAPYLMCLIAPGFAKNPGQLQTAINLTRLMLISPIFFSLSNILGGILNSFKRFVAYSLAPIFYNIGIIAGALFLGPIYGIYGLAIGVIAGSILHFLVQLPSSLQVGYRYRPFLKISHPAIKQIAKLTVPRTLALGINQLNLVISTIIGSVLRGGSIAIINIANNIQTFPTVVFGISLATTVFPHLAERASKGESQGFVEDFSWGFRQIMFLIIPSTVGIIILRAQIIRIVLGTSNFSWQDTQLASMVLGAFALSFVAQAAIPLLSRSFFALKDTKTPLVAALIAAVINVTGAFSFAYLLGKDNGAIGLALAFSLAAFFESFLLFVLLRKKLGWIDGSKILKSLIKISVAALLMGGVVQGSKYLFSFVLPTEKFLGILGQTLGSVAIGALSFCFFTMILKAEEIGAIKNVLKNKFTFKNNKNEEH